MGARLAMVLRPLLSMRLAELNLPDLMDALLDMGQQWGVVGPEPLILFGKQLGYFERYAVDLAPDWVLGNDPSCCATSRPARSVRPQRRMQRTAEPPAIEVLSPTCGGRSRWIERHTFSRPMMHPADMKPGSSPKPNNPWCNGGLVIIVTDSAPPQQICKYPTRRNAVDFRGRRCRRDHGSRCRNPLSACVTGRKQVVGYSCSGRLGGRTFIAMTHPQCQEAKCR